MLGRLFSKNRGAAEGFDAEFYASYYKDLSHLHSQRELLEHYRQHGEREGRYKSFEDAVDKLEAKFGKLPEGFDPDAYGRVNKDIGEKHPHPVQLIAHYLEFGKKERRRYREVPGGEAEIEYENSYELTDASGVVPARRPRDRSDFAIEVPFRCATPPITRSGAVAAIVHCRRPDKLSDLLQKLTNLPTDVDLFVSTDMEGKRAAIFSVARQWTKGTVDVRVFESGGRNVSALIVGFADIVAKYDVFLNLNDAEEKYPGLIDYNVDALIGSPDIAASNLHLLESETVGLVFPQHFPRIRNFLDWGYDYEVARRLLSSIGETLTKKNVLDFPSGFTFFARAAAIRGLLDLDLSLSDFPASDDDGAITRAVERTILMFAEARGYEWLKVVRRDSYPFEETILVVEKLDDVRRYRTKVFQRCLSRVDPTSAITSLGIVEAKPLLSYPSRNEKPRLNVVIPTVNPHETYGGVSTAIRLFEEVAGALGSDFDRRIIVADSAINDDAYARFPGFTPTPLCPTTDEAGFQLVDASGSASGRLNLREKDIFVATAWWTARQVAQLTDDQERYFGQRRRFVYFVQDFEPFFYGWGTRWALAEATYRRGDDVIAIVNSEELFLEMTARYPFSDAFCYPYKLNDTISACLSERPRERIILVYARPNVGRNAFELILDALFDWQQRDPVTASRWKIVCLGESFDERLASPVNNVVVEGKVSLQEYADYLSRAAVGVSLMLSPHPSYPPLEMAEAGVATITNRHGGKDLSVRCDGVASLDYLEVDKLSAAVEHAVHQTEPRIGNIVRRREMRASQLPPDRLFDPERVATLIKAETEKVGARRWARDQHAGC